MESFLPTCLLVVLVCGAVCARDTVCGSSDGGIKCTLNPDQKLDVTPSLIPRDTEDLEISGGAEVRIQANAFSQLHGGGLRRVAVSNATRLVLAKHAFHNLSTVQLFLNVSHCRSVVVETGAFKSIQGPLALQITDSADVVIQGSSLSWILSVLVRECPSLKLHEHAFSQESHYVGHHGPSTQIILEKVEIKELPRNAFISAMMELRVVESHIGVIRQNAFSAASIGGVTILNSSVDTIEENGFSDRTVISRLILQHTLVRSLESNALRSPVLNLEIQHSRIIDVKRDAVNCLTLAVVKLTSNQFDHVQTRGFALRDWNRISIDNNTFLDLASSAFKSSPYDEPLTSSFERVLNFTGNHIHSSQPHSFDFAVLDFWHLHVADNRFRRDCSCHFDAFLTPILSGTPRAVDAFRNSSFCEISRALAECHRHPEGFVAVRDFVGACSNDSHPECVPRQPLVPNDDSTSFLNLLLLDNVDKQHLVLVGILIFVSLLLSSIVVIWSVQWVKNSRVRSKSDLLKSSKSFSRCSLLSRFFSSGMNSASSSSTHSISRMSVHEYAELNLQKLHEEELDLGIPMEDKATQTLPEGFTQELLQSLNEKLEDPDATMEARVMIMHLYDLIKVEESCDNNLIDSSLDVEQVYETIGPPRRHRPNATFISRVSVGTRVPSPDKLEPVKLWKAMPQVTKPTLCEYNDPHDMERHVYLELPSESSPMTSPMTSPSTSTSTPPMPPLPSSFRPSTAGAAPGVRFQNYPHAQGSVICDYNEPHDSAVHIYSEVPASMINRPLPGKPEDLEDATTASSGYSSR
nr:PREDICTED: uncharacterized protein LOC109030757 [Bemisia tabaci]